MICSHFAGMKGLQRLIGVPIKPGRIRLDVLIPLGPPPEYERSGYDRSLVKKNWT